MLTFIARISLTVSNQRKFHFSGQRGRLFRTWKSFFCVSLRKRRRSWRAYVEYVQVGGLEIVWKNVSKPVRVWARSCSCSKARDGLCQSWNRWPTLTTKIKKLKLDLKSKKSWIRYFVFHWPTDWLKKVLLFELVKVWFSLEGVLPLQRVDDHATLHRGKSYVSSDIRPQVFFPESISSFCS